MRSICYLRRSDWNLFIFQFNSLLCDHFGNWFFDKTGSLMLYRFMHFCCKKINLWRSVSLSFGTMYCRIWLLMKISIWFSHNFKYKIHLRYRFGEIIFLVVNLGPWKVSSTIRKNKAGFSIKLQILIIKIFWPSLFSPKSRESKTKLYRSRIDNFGYWI